jgi:hypothetical protein
MTRLREQTGGGLNHDIDHQDAANSSTEQPSKHDTLAKFSKLVVNLINMYEKYYNQQIKELNSSSETTTSNNANPNTSMSNLNQSISKTTLFDQFISIFDELTEFVLTNKRDNFASFMGLFQHANLITIQFYEFINKLLNVYEGDNMTTSNHNSNNEYLLTHMMGLNDLKVNQESKSIIVSQALQLLNILTSSIFLNF